MRESIGSTFTLNMIILFIIIVFGILAATMSYYKAFKINSRILDALEQYEGYNEPAKNEINRILASIGYPANASKSKCAPERDGAKLSSISEEVPWQLYCVYYHKNDTGKNDAKRVGTKNKNNEPIYYNYSVASYIYIDLPTTRPRLGEILNSDKKATIVTKGKTFNIIFNTKNDWEQYTNKHEYNVSILNFEKQRRLIYKGARILLKDGNYSGVVNDINDYGM